MRYAESGKEENWYCFGVLRHFWKVKGWMECILQPQKLWSAIENGVFYSECCYICVARAKSGMPPLFQKIDCLLLEANTSSMEGKVMWLFISEHVNVRNDLN